jgi:hypothetical protein
MSFNTAVAQQQQAAFNVLATIVDRWYVEGRRAYGASLKPEMRAVTSEGFDEGLLGFPTFKAFLMGAASAGLVDVHRAPNSPDVQVVPKGKEPLMLRQGPTRFPFATGGPRVREDLWKAFVDWNTAFERFYDRVEGRAYRVAATESALDGPALKELREQKRNDPRRFVGIAPVTYAEQVDWMRQFAEKQSPEIQLRLTQALDTARARGFSFALRQIPTMSIAWQKERFQRVVERIDAWKAENELTVEIYETLPLPPQRADRRAHQSAAALDVERLRERVHAAVDSMSVGELLELPIRLRHIVDVEL